jgi:hypothetical protein
MARHPLKTAPRRVIRSIERHGDWGEVTYRHHLTCGHTEVRKRKSPAGIMACSGCLTATDFAAGIIAAPPDRTRTFDSPWVDDMAGLETKASQVRAGLAKRFGVDAEAVDVALRGDDIAYAIVFLDGDVARRLAKVDISTER